MKKDVVLLEKGEFRMITAVYSILHFLVDGVCAFAMAGFLAGAGYERFLIYNFCAFALQMPFGILLDGLEKTSKRRVSFGAAGAGVCLTLIGAWASPAVLGLGNALFHVGAGIGVIREDYAKDWKGQALGVFVAPGALGLFAGGLLASGNPGITFIIAAAAMGMLLLTLWKKEFPKMKMVEKTNRSKETGVVLVCCFVVVVLRSYVGMAVTFPWKTTVTASFLGVLAVVLGKVAGGVLAARTGIVKTVAGSLGMAAVCYLLSDHLVFGILGLFFFNMTMPITLYLLVDQLNGFPGLSFGILTFGLFLGFLPVYFGMETGYMGNWLGAAGSVLSLVIILAAVRCKRK